MGDGSAARRATAKRTHPSDQLSQGAFGNWQGSLATPDGLFRVTLHIWPGGSGSLTGTVDDVDHDVNDVPISSANLKDSVFRFEAAGGSFDGKLSVDESTIEGAWAQHGVSTPLHLKRVSE